MQQFQGFIYLREHANKNLDKKTDSIWYQGLESMNILTRVQFFLGGGVVGFKTSPIIFATVELLTYADEANPE